jgi:prepilin-type N-terminal cleavage/methylation domain-containing protein
MHWDLRTKDKKEKGFTLIELIIVMAILGLLAVIVLVLVNPVERLAQARDSNRMTSITQLGHSLQAYYTTNSAYPATATWAQDLVAKGEISTFPSGVPYSAYSVTNCTTFVQPATNQTFCYNQDEANGNGAIVFAKAESTSFRSKCTAPEEAFFVYATVDGHGGVICSNVDPLPWAAGSRNYVN